MSTGSNLVVGRQPVWRLEFIDEPVAVAAAVGEPLAALEPAAVSLPPAQPASEEHVATALPSAKYLSGIESYATGKEGIGFCGWRFFSRRSQAKTYLRENNVDLKKVLPKMPWNASRSLCVLCLLVAKGFTADQIHTIFDGKDKVERGDLSLLLDDGILSAQDVTNLLACETPTFLKHVTNLAAIEGDGRLIIEADATDEVKDAAIGRLVNWAADGSGYEAAARDLLDRCLLAEDVPLRPALARYCRDNVGGYLNSHEPEDLAHGLMYLILLLKKGDADLRREVCALAMQRLDEIGGFLGAEHEGIKRNALHLLSLLIEHGEGAQKTAVCDLAMREKANLQAILDSAEGPLQIQILALLGNVLENSGDRQDLKKDMSQLALDYGRLPDLIFSQNEPVQINSLILLTNVVRNCTLAQWWTVQRTIDGKKTQIEHLRDRAESEDVRDEAVELLRVYEQTATGRR